MFRRMRLHKQQLDEDSCREILQRRTSGVLSLVGDDGYPYGVPLSYVFSDGKIYFHGASSGHKLDAIRSCHKACFTVIDHDQVVSAEYTTYFKAVVAFGKVRILEDPTEMKSALMTLGMKYCAAHEEGMEPLVDKRIGQGAVSVIELSVEHLTGKQASELMD